MELQGIDYFGKQHPLAQLHNQSTLKMRHKMYEFFRSRVSNISKKVFLDHGSTPDTQRAASNCFLRWLVEDGATVYACSPEDIHHLELAIPGVKVIDWPLDERYLFEKPDYILSSAVIEHVGSENSQVEYLRSLLLISPQLFITTPNRFHWLEFHTKIPLIHWLPRRVHRKILRIVGLKFWADEKNLHLISRNEFERIIRIATENLDFNISLNWYTPSFLGMISNLCVLIQCYPK